MVFELDSKQVIDSVNSNNLDASNFFFFFEGDASNFDAIIRDCRHTFASHFRNSC